LAGKPGAPRPCSSPVRGFIRVFSETAALLPFATSPQRHPLGLDTSQKPSTDYRNQRLTSIAVCDKPQTPSQEYLLFSKPKAATTFGRRQRRPNATHLFFRNGNIAIQTTTDNHTAALNGRLDASRPNG